LKSKLEWLTGAGGVAGAPAAAGDAEDAGAGAPDDATATVSAVVLDVVPEDAVEVVEDDEDDATGPVPASIFATTGAAPERYQGD
jgi:hypothetical protein